MATKNVTIIGAGLVGSLLSIYLAKQGNKVTIYERRPDMRLHNISAGRSINLALSERGWRGLRGAGLEDKILAIAIPMYRRVMHATDGSLTQHPYGAEGQAIYSVSRAAINKELISLAEAHEYVKLHFNKTVQEINLDTNTIFFENNQSERYEWILGADGAFSPLRNAMLRTENFNYSQQFEAHGYKELNIPPDKAKKFNLDSNALHIWPREHFMMIALPNINGDFTCTLFLPLKGNLSFEQLHNDESILSFFQTYFKDAIPMMNTLLEDFKQNPTSSLVTIRCYPWKYRNACLLGDAAHAIIPFYGQGMNCGFEDCTTLNELLSYDEDWHHALELFQQQRKPNADAIAEMACDNFIEMRDLTGKSDFLAKKKIEKILSEMYPGKFIPQYTQVTFSHLPYSLAQRNGRKQWQLLDDLYAQQSPLEGLEDRLAAMNLEYVL